MKNVFLLFVMISTTCFGQVNTDNFFNQYVKNYNNLIDNFELVKDSLNQIIQQRDSYANLVEQKKDALEKAKLNAEKENPKPVKDEFETTEQYNQRIGQWEKKINALTAEEKYEVRSAKVNIKKNDKTYNQAKEDLKLIERHLAYLKSLDFDTRTVELSEMNYDADKKVFDIKIKGNDEVFKLYVHDIAVAKEMKNTNKTFKVLYTDNAPYRLSFKDKAYNIELKKLNSYPRYYYSKFIHYFLTGTPSVLTSKEHKKVIKNIHKVFNKKGGNYITNTACSQAKCEAYMVLTMDRNGRVRVTKFDVDGKSALKNSYTKGNGEVLNIDVINQRLNNSSEIMDLLPDKCMNIFLKLSDECHYKLKWFYVN